jgi:hypothetical protein
MKCFSLTIGSRNTPKAAAKFSQRDDRTIQKVTTRYFPNGSTILKASGFWFDPVAKKFVSEESRQILVCALKKRELQGWYRDLCYALQQKSLMLVKLGPVDFVNADPIKLLAMRTGVKATKITGASRQAPKTTM